MYTTLLQKYVHKGKHEILLQENEPNIAPDKTLPSHMANERSCTQAYCTNGKIHICVKKNLWYIRSCGGWSTVRYNNKKRHIVKKCYHDLKASWVVSLSANWWYECTSHNVCYISLTTMFDVPHWTHTIRSESGLGGRNKTHEHYLALHVRLI